MSDVDNDMERPKVSDGKTDREIWQPEDGNGDPTLKTYEETQYATGGHPTWKIYCGDAPEKIEGVLVEPPKNCYLDDRAAYKVLNWDGYTKAERGRFWRNDFSNKGDIRPHRKHRGRPAFLLGGEIASLQGGARVYRFSGAIAPSDIAVINEELNSQKDNKALARLMPSTNISLAKEPVRKGLNASNQLKHFAQPTSPDESVDFDRELSPLTADMQDPPNTNPAKRPRYDSTTPSNLGQRAHIHPSIIADLKSQNLLLSERNEQASTKSRDLTRENNNLQTELASTKTLWAATSKELATLRAQYRETQDALRVQAAADPDTNTAALQLARNEKTTYRNLSKQLFAKLQTSADTLEKGVAAVRGVKDLAQELGITPKEEMPLENEDGAVQRDLNNIRTRMKAILGEEWNRFEREAFDEKDC